MLVLRQTVTVASGCVLGAVAVGIFLTASAPPATRSLDYLLAAMVFLIGFAAGTALAERFTPTLPVFAASPATVDEAPLGELGPLESPSLLGSDLTKTH